MTKAKREQYRDIFVFPFDHPLHHIVFDPREHKYYHKKSDIFLGDEDIAAYKLRDPVTIPRNVTISQVITLYFTEESCKSSSHIQTLNNQSDVSTHQD